MSHPLWSQIDDFYSSRLLPPDPVLDQALADCRAATPPAHQRLSASGQFPHLPRYADHFLARSATLLPMARKPGIHEHTVSSSLFQRQTVANFESTPSFMRASNG
jgi:hypothetical protein